MIYHVLPGDQLHHVPGMINVLDKHASEIGVDREEQVFLLYTTPPIYKGSYQCLGIPSGRLRFSSSRRIDSSLLDRLKKNDLLIFHSLFFRGFWLSLCRRPQICKNIAVIIWGGEIPALALQKLRKRAMFKQWRKSHRHPWSWKQIVKVPWRAAWFVKTIIFIYIDVTLRSIIFPRLGAICTGTPGEFEIINELHGPCHNYVPMVFLTNTTDFKPCSRKKTTSTLKVLLGNSGKETNEHLEVLSWLSRFKDENMQIICPLGYPRMSYYKREVIETGRRLLGDKFVPLVDMIPKAEYSLLLETIDVFILNAKRQQGAYCVYSLLLGGKKVYLSTVSPVYEIMTERGIKVFDVCDIPASTFQEFSSFSPEAGEKNHHIGQQQFSLQASLRAWNALIVKMKEKTGVY